MVGDLAGSVRFRLACFEAIWNTGRVVTINVPQCALGFVVDGQRTYTNTALLPSSTSFIAPLKGWQCICKAHGTLDGRCGIIAKAKFAHAWPRDTCHHICTGIRPPVRQWRRRCLIHGSDVCCPAGVMASGRRRVGRPRKHPEGIVSRQGVIYDCPVCVRRLHKLRLAHTCNRDPPHCCASFTS